MRFAVMIFTLLLVIFSGFTINDVFAESQTVIVDAGESEGLSFYLKEGDRIQFQITVDGGSNDDNVIKIRNPTGGTMNNGRIVESFGDSFTAQETGNYYFEFDNGMPFISDKRVYFSYEIIKRLVTQAVSNTARDVVGGGCLIATVAYGSELAPQVQLLREIRDNSLL